MADGPRSVLLAGLDDRLARWVVVALSPLGVDFHRMSWSAAVAKPESVLDADVVVAHHDGDRSLLDWLSALGGWSPAGLRAGAVVVLCSADLVDEVESFHGRGVSRVVLVGDSGDRLRDVVRSLLGVARRVRLQVPVRLISALAGERGGRIGNTENLSLTGMLLSCTAGFRLGSTYQFELSAPGHELPIRGLTKVVRRVDPDREGVQGIGARFLSVIPSDRDRFERWLASELQ